MKPRYIQTVGRGMRIKENTGHFLVLEFVGNTEMETKYSHRCAYRSAMYHKTDWYEYRLAELTLIEIYCRNAASILRLKNTIRKRTMQS